MRFLFQDQTGYIWFRSESGLFRLDGVRTEEIELLDPDSSGTIQFIPRDFAQDAEGQVYFCSREGVSVFRPESGACELMAGISDGDDGGLQIEFDHENRLWLLRRGRVFRYDFAARKALPVVFDPPLSTEDEVRSFGFDGSGRTWLGFSKGLVVVHDQADRRLASYRAALGSELNDVVVDLAFPESGRVYVITLAGMFRIDETEGRAEEVRLPGAVARFEAILEDREGRLWLGNAEGLWRQDEKGVEVYRNDPGELFSLPDSRVVGLLRDRSGAIWVSTYRGLSRFDGRPGRFEFIGLPSDSEDGRRDVAVSVLRDRAGRTFVGGLRTGLKMYRAGSTEEFSISLGAEAADDSTVERVRNRVVTILELHDGSILCGTQMGGLFRLAPDSTTAVAVSLPAEAKERPRLRDLIQLPDGRIWVVMRDEVVLLDRDLVPMGPPLATPRVGSIGARILPNASCILEDGTLLALAAPSSIVRARPEALAMTRLEVEGDSAVIESGMPRSIARLGPGSFVLATSMGLSRLEFLPGRDRAKIRTLKTTSAWGAANLAAVEVDARGRIWLATMRRGLVAIDGQTGATLAQYGQRHGLYSEECYLNATWRSPDGNELGFGTLQGALFFRPDAIDGRGPGPKVVVTRVDIPGVPEATRRSPLDRDWIELPGSNANVLVEFAALDYLAPEVNEFSYRIVEQGGDWINCGSSRTAAFTKLEPGEHTILVRARNADGTWSSEPARLRVRVIPSFWQTLWFRVLSTGGVFVLVFLGLQSRVSAIKKRNAALAEEIRRRERVEFDLRANKAKLHSVFNAVPYDFWQMNAAGVYEAQNRISVERWGDHRGQRLEDLAIPAEQKNRWARQVQEAIAGDIVREEAVLEVAGQVIEVIEVVAPVRIDEAIIGVFGLVIDISRLRAAEREARALDLQLRQAQKLEAIGLLAGGVAHDFNNILTGILGSAELGLKAIQQAPPAIDRLQQDLESIRKSSRRAKDITGQLLTFSHGESAGLQTVDLGRLVTGMSEFLRSMIARSIELNLVIDSHPCLVRLDPVRMEQVVMNLVINAAAAMPQGGRIGLEVRNRSQLKKPCGTSYVVLSVTDSGSGMTEDVQARIFEPFYTTKTDGDGFGLTASRRSIQDFGGWIDVASALGQGARFDVWLPARGRVEVATPRGRAVIGLDQESVANLVQAVLEREGYQVSLVMGPADVIEMMEMVGDDITLIVGDLRFLTRPMARLLAHLKRLRPQVLLVVLLHDDDVMPGDSDLRPEELVILRRPFGHGILLKTIRQLIKNPGFDAQRKNQS